VASPTETLRDRLLTKRPEAGSRNLPPCCKTGRVRQTPRSHLCRQTHKRVRVEYPITVNDWLKGTLNYYFPDLLVIEAKRDNLENGFTQLAVELIALDQWTNSDTPILYGSVTTGNDWRFGEFHRQQRQIIQDFKLYRVPEELEILIGILIGLLSKESG
jgi:hypothetical protein